MRGRDAGLVSSDWVPAPIDVPGETGRYRILRAIATLELAAAA